MCRCNISQGIRKAVAELLEHPAYAAVVLFGLLCGWRFFWLIGVAAGVLNHPISGVFRKKRYNKIARQHGLLQ